MKKEAIAPAAVYLAGFALAMVALSSFTGWGASAESAIAIPSLSRVSFFGSHLPIAAGRLFSELLPLSSPEFAANVTVAILAGFTFAYFFLAVRLLSGRIIFAVAAVAGLALYPGFLGSFSSVNEFSLTLFLAACITTALARNVSAGNLRGIYTAAFLTGLGAFHSGFLFIFGTTVTVYMVLSAPGAARLRTSAMAALSFLAGTMPLAINFTRPAIIVNFTSTLPPWLGSLQPIDNLGSRVINMGTFGEMGINLLAISSILAGAYIIFFLAWVAAAFFFSDKLPARGRIIWLLPLPSAFFFMVSAPDARHGYEILFILFVSLSGACGAAAFSSGIHSRPIRAASAVAAAVILAAPPVYMYHRDFSSIVPDHSREYTVSLLGNMKRDAIFMINPDPDYLQSINYLRLTKGLRRDVALTYPTLMLDGTYRDFQRRSMADSVLTPGEDEYRRLYNRIASLAPMPGSGSAGATVKQRIHEGMTEIVNEALILRNGDRRPIYYNRIDHLFNSRIYSFMYFEPVEYMFKLGVYNSEPFSYSRYEDMFLEMFDRPADDDPMVRVITATYFMNIGEHFYMQERFKSAFPLLEACAELDDKNIKCPFFLGNIYRKWGQYDLSTVNYKIALDLLSEKSRREKHTSTDYLMLSNIYRELGMPDLAQKYENKVQPGGLNTPIPGSMRPDQM